MLSNLERQTGMNRSIIKKLKFLERQGFKRKVCSRNGDSEIYYTKSNSTIEVHYYQSTLMRYCLEVIIDCNGKRENIFHCTSFNQAEISCLEKEFYSINPPDPLQKQLDLYAEFLKKHAIELSQ